jgi:hypothetical protein
MPPDQRDGAADLVDEGFGLGTHAKDTPKAKARTRVRAGVLD